MHTITIAALVVIFVGVGCEPTRKTSSDKRRFVEYVAVTGECWEDHVTRVPQHGAMYQGSLVHWHNQSKNSHSRYGSVLNESAVDPENMMKAIQHPDQYRPPFIVSFDDIPEKEFLSNTMKLSGRATNHEGIAGYKATCTLTVVERLDHMPRSAGSSRNVVK